MTIAALRTMLSKSDAIAKWSRSTSSMRTPASAASPNFGIDYVDMVFGQKVTVDAEFSRWHYDPRVLSNQQPETDGSRSRASKQRVIGDTIALTFR